MLEEAKVALAKPKDDMMLYYNQKWTPAPEFKAGDMVFLDASDIQTTWSSHKLSHQRLGPFLIDNQVGNSVYQLRLPPLMGRLHPIFNVVKLSLAPPDPIPGRRTTLCYDFDRFSLYRRDRIQSVSDNAQASVQGASWAHEYQLEDVQSSIHRFENG